MTDLRRGIGYVIQQTGLFPHQTIVENVGTVPRLLGWPAARIKERSEELLGGNAPDSRAQALEHGRQHVRARDVQVPLYVVVGWLDTE